MNVLTYVVLAGCVVVGMAAVAAAVICSPDLEDMQPEFEEWVPSEEYRRAS